MEAEKRKTKSTEKGVINIHRNLIADRHIEVKTFFLIILLQQMANGHTLNLLTTLMTFIRVARVRYDQILYPSLRVVERAEVLPEFLETSGDKKKLCNFISLMLI